MNKHLSDFEKFVILQKGTEQPFTGKYTFTFDFGTYTCKQCASPLFSSAHKFFSTCGWASFDDELPAAVLRVPDADGLRTEIVCAQCGGHLGHEFVGEGYTSKNIRHCVNSASIDFEPKAQEGIAKVYFANGCFWGTQYWFEKAVGVVSCKAGYIGGHTKHPLYADVCSGATGHAECVEVVYDMALTNFETLAKLFFNTHDPTQINRQGPDIGEQYRSEIFYTSLEQKYIAESLFVRLYAKGYELATEITRATEFYEAEEYHQHYYAKQATQPYCHVYNDKFV